MSGSESWLGEVVQLEKPYYSTIAIEQFLCDRNAWRPGTKVLDIGTGVGANLLYFRERWPTIDFVGMDYNVEKIEQGRRVINDRKIAGVSLEVGDIWKLPPQLSGTFDGVILIHTLCVFRRIEPALKSVIDLRPRWIAINSLFYPGPVEVMIAFREMDKPWLDDNPDGDFNIFSLPKVTDFLGAHGYRVTSEPFYPPEPIPRRGDNGRGTFTMATELSPRTQFSGPVHLPWYFLYADRED